MNHSKLSQLQVKNFNFIKIFNFKNYRQQEYKNQWDEHASVHDEQMLIEKGIFPNTGVIRYEEKGGGNKRCT